MRFPFTTNRICTALLAAGLLSLALPLAGAAELPSSFRGSNRLRVEVSGPRATASSEIAVELWTSQSQLVRRETMRGGEFEFRDLAAGNYEVRVTDPMGAVQRTAFVSVGYTPVFVQLELPEKQPEPVSGTVSVAALRHKPPAKAKKEYERGMDASIRGDLPKAISHFERAIEIDPAFSEAYSELGVRHMRLDRFQEAAEQFEKGVRLDERSPELRCNLAVSYIYLRRFQDAEASARIALRYNPASNNLHYVLGVALEGQQRELDEALGHLSTASREFPQARLAAARILTRAGDKKGAAAELKKYLSSYNGPNRQSVEQWLAKLTK